jgi:anion-transporting  ArsA/GET3 family ATPase
MSESPKGNYYFPNYRPAYDPAIIENNLSGSNLKLKQAIEEYLEIVFKVPLITKRIARNSLFQVLTTALPGLEALVMLGKIWYEFERRYQGKPYWDKIVVDAPATGHGLALLRFPTAALDIVKSGPIADRSHDINNLLKDQSKTSLIVVSLLEELPVDEGLELTQKIQADTPYRVRGIVQNGAYPDVAKGDPRYQAWLKGQADAGLAAALGQAEVGIRSRLNWLETWRQGQAELAPRLASLGLPVYDSPWIPAASERELIEAFVARLSGKGPHA